MRLKLLCLLFFTIGGFAQDFKTPLDYLEYIDKEKSVLSESTWNYTLASALKNHSKIAATRKELIKTIQTARKKIGKIKNGYLGDVEYRDLYLNYLDFYEKSLKQEYDQIVDFNVLSEQSYDAMDALIQLEQLINAKLDEENKKVDLAYQAFLKKYQLEPVATTNEWNEKITIYNEISNYHAAIYLIYFKVNFTDAHLSTAVLKGDLGEIQQNSNALVQLANEGLSQLKSITPYKGDYSVINAANLLLEYYKKEGEEYIPKLVAFLMFSDKVENARKTLESKSEKDRTKEETDNFELMAKERESQINIMKKAYYDNLVQKANILRKWRIAGDDFIARHIPKN